MDDVNNILEMSNLFNNKTIDNNKNPKVIEKEVIKNNLDIEFINKDDSMAYNPLDEYNNMLEHILDNTSSNYTETTENDKLKNNQTDYNDSNDELDELLNLPSIDLQQQSSNKIEYDTKNINDHENKYDDYNNFTTKEQINQKTVDTIFNKNFSNDNNYEYNYNLEDENREDLKMTLLEKIDNLTEELEDDGISLEKVPKVEYSSDLEKIEYVAKLLMLKSNRNRYATLGEEFILALANGLELVCNGEREFLGIKPDLQGYSDVVKVKLRRLRNETSQVVGNIVEKYEISPFTTLLIELIPGMYLHSKRRKKQSYDSLYNDLNDDINEIRKYN